MSASKITSLNNEKLWKIESVKFVATTMFPSLLITHSRTQTPKLCSGPASWPPGRLPWQPSEFTLCKHLVPETDCVTRSWTFTYSKPPQTAAPLSCCNHNIVQRKQVNSWKSLWSDRRRDSELLGAPNETRIFPLRSHARYNLNASLSTSTWLDSE